MSPMNVVTALVRTPAISVERFEHPPGAVHRDPEREVAGGHAVNFVEAGSFWLRFDGAWRRLTPEHVFVTQPGLEYSCRHDDDGPPRDRCLTVRYSAAAVESLRSAGALPATRPVLALTNRRAYLRHELEAGAANEVARTEALAGALFWTLAVPAAARPRFRPGQLTWYAARVRRAKDLIETRYAEPLPLSRLAREVGMSLYHFARAFSELEGEAPHRYLVRVRLERARSRLLRGAPVTETCYACGFGSLSHFTTTFRRRFGVSPSGFARAGAAPRSPLPPALEGRQQVTTAAAHGRRSRLG
jgi:AraC-like DNA-binding protein